MKKSHIIRCLIATTMAIVVASCTPTDKRKAELNSLYEQIDEEIGRSQNYVQEKQKYINHLKLDLRSQQDEHARLRIYDNLITAYEAFVCDSALKYVEEARVVAAEIGDRREENRLLIKKADIASHAGLFKEAYDILRGIDRGQLDSRLLTDLYSAYCNMYQYESEYMPDGEYTNRSKRLRSAYTDSLMAVNDTTSFSYLTNWTFPQIRKGNFPVVTKRLKDSLHQYEPGTRQYSILASTMATMYKMMDDQQNYKYYLAKTVISDIKGAVKENMAIRELATCVFEDGDIERANHYMKVSLDDAGFYASRLSDAQSRRMMPVIDKAYDTQQLKLQTRQRVLIYIISFLLLVSVIIGLNYMRQLRLLREANHKVNLTNTTLSQMSERLQDMNTELERSNAELVNSNRTTQEYAGLFMEFCSLTISNLQKYHLALRNLAVQGNVKGLLKKLDSGDITDETLKDFYSKFDEAILNIYPQFVDKVNELLRPEEQIQLKGSERLNTELRILALIKIGITDSEKIAQFLRCSITTIYTYRSKLKRRAVNPEDFEKSLIFI